MTERWRAEMPKVLRGERELDFCRPGSVLAIVTRANAELDAAEAEVTALRRENAELKQDVSELRFCLRTASNRNAAEAENRELRDKVAALEAERLERRQLPPLRRFCVHSLGYLEESETGDVVMFSEVQARTEQRNVTLIRHKRERDEARAKVAALEARVRELTEWRPMETAPKTQWPILVKTTYGKEIPAYWIDGRAFSEGEEWYESDFRGWLPLPSTEGGAS